SCWIVRHDARAVALLDLDHDGWPEAFVTRNNDTALLFKNHPRPGRSFFNFTLQGTPGNPTAVGARLLLTLRNGATEFAEITDGGTGQSSPTVFFGYPDSAPPVKLKIRWPDGRETEQTLTSGTRNLLRVSAP